MKFLQTLSESQLLNSKASYKKFTAKQVAELVYLHVIALRIIATEPLTHKWAHDYAVRTARYLGFTKWYQNATDLHLLLHALIAEDVDLRLPDSSSAFKETLYLDEMEIRRWLKDLVNGRVNEPHTKSLFIHLDGQLQIRDSSMKAIRRIVQDWPHNTQRQKQLAMTRLLQIMRVRCRQSDLLTQLNHLATELDLELENVANKETGDEPEHDGSDPHYVEHHPKQPKVSGLAKATAAFAGGILGYHTIKSFMESARFVVEPYHNSTSGYGPYYRVRDTKVNAVAGQEVKGVAYPVDGFQTRRSAETAAKKLNDEADTSLAEAEKQLEEEAVAGVTCAGDVAQVAQPMMTTQRRIPRKKKAKKSP